MLARRGITKVYTYSYTMGFYAVIKNNVFEE